MSRKGQLATLEIFFDIHKDKYGEEEPQEGVSDFAVRVIKSLEGERKQLRELCGDALEVIHALLPGLRHISVPDYAKINDVPIKLRQALQQAALSEGGKDKDEVCPDASPSCPEACADCIEGSDK